MKLLATIMQLCYCYSCCYDSNIGDSKRILLVHTPLYEAASKDLWFRSVATMKMIRSWVQKLGF